MLDIIRRRITPIPHRIYPTLLPRFNVTSIVVNNAPGDTSGCGVRLDGLPRMVYMVPETGPIETGIQVEEVFVQACNATYNFTSQYFELTADQAANAQPVYLEGGGVIRVDPDDYVEIYVRSA